MTGRRVEELAEQVLRELRKEGRIFATDHVRKEDGLWAIAFSHGKTLLEAFINLKTHNTEEVIKEEIRRQLVAQAEMLEKRPPSKLRG
jgi:2-polyprenyl-3-methyl-5-hydroxy-6-metoxy-1,4-benzoquinol methylase